MNTVQTIDALQALAQEHRLAAFRLLVQAGPPGLAAGEIARSLAVAPASLSFHLNQLAQAGLVASRRDGRSIIYAANFAAIEDLVGFLTENCCRGSGGTCGPSLSVPLAGEYPTEEIES